MSNMPYVVITGAGQGLGKAFAEECASHKMNLVMTALPGENLTATAASLADRYHVNAIVYETDLSQEQNCFLFFEFVMEQKVPVNMLINNAGIGSIAAFENLDPVFYQQQVKLNTLAPVLLSRLFMPILKKQSSAFILNVSSLASFFFIPGKEVYGATKSFLYSFSLSLRNSLLQSSVSVSVLCPGGIDTNERVKEANGKLSGFAKRSILSPQSVARYTIPLVLKKRAVIIPGGINRASLLLDRWLPNAVKSMLIRWTFNRQSAR